MIQLHGSEKVGSSGNDETLSALFFLARVARRGMESSGTHCYLSSGTLGACDLVEDAG